MRVNADGSPDEESKGDVFLWISKDLIHFEELGLVCLKKDVYVEEAVCIYDISIRQYVIKWLGSDGVYYRNTLTDLRNVNSVSVCVPGESFSAAYSGNGPEGAVNGNVLSVDHSFGERLSLRWTPLENVSVKVPESITVMNEEDVRSIQATAYYTDGSTAQKRVKWDVEGIDFNKPGVYKICGTVVSNTYSFPLAKGYADPDILFWDGKYYFIATNDNTNDVGLYVREADTVAGLFEERVKEYLILEKDEKRDLIQTFWAPEFHVIGGELYILFAVSGKKWGPMSHMMRLKKKGNILDPDSWEDPVRVQKKDGSFLTTGEAEITLDMTFFEADGICYLAWSYRIWTGTPHDSGSMIYIATIDPVEPWQLTSNPVLLSRPQYGWENNEHTINNEGPYAFVTNDRVYLTYSGGAAGGYTYVLGLLSAKKGRGSAQSKKMDKKITRRYCPIIQWKVYMAPDITLFIPINMEI